MKKLVLVRGCPGAGKSTLAREMLLNNTNSAHFETDMYWVRPDGTYDFNIKLIEEAHKWCHRCVENLMSLNRTPIIVSNTFTVFKEVRFYVDLAVQYGYYLEIITLLSQYANVHNVPEKTLKKMQARFESSEQMQDNILKYPLSDSSELVLSVSVRS